MMVSLSSADGTIRVRDLPELFVKEAGLMAQAAFHCSMYDRVQQMIEEADGNKSEAARRLGISRRHLHRILAG